jgi:D-arabinose 1-dehydrogenase-like Zn-dependent alcohol dehydrogenase
MKAAVYREKGSLGVEEVPTPAVGPGEILVRVDVCGVCVTDVKKIQKGLLAGPRIFGHEMAGTVATAGDQTGWKPVTGWWWPTPRRAAPASGACGAGRTSARTSNT